MLDSIAPPALFFHAAAWLIVGAVIVMILSFGYISACNRLRTDGRSALARTREHEAAGMALAAIVLTLTGLVAFAVGAVSLVSN